MTHLGIDAGGTSTRAVVVDPDGHCLGHGRSGSGNPISSGPHVAAASLREAAEQALAAAGLPGSAVGSTSVAMAGGSRIAEDDEVAATIRGALVAAGVHASLAVEPDLLALYFSGTHEPSGYALVAGTGAAAVRVVEGEVVATCDGLGWLLGDGGSGFWIGREVVRAVCADLDGRGPSTALTPLLLEAAPGTDPPPRAARTGRRAGPRPAPPRPAAVCRAARPPGPLRPARLRCGRRRPTTRWRPTSSPGRARP